MVIKHLSWEGIVVMVDLQILNKCISSGNFDLVVNNNLTEDYFAVYPDEYNFI